MSTSEIGQAFKEGLFGKKRPSYKDPWEYFGAAWDDPPEKGAPMWARAAWLGKPYLNKGTGVLVPGNVTLTTPGHELAGIGGKGSAKTFTFGMRDVHLIQYYPGSKGLIVANTYAQAYGTGGAKLVEIASAMSIEWFHRSEMMIDGVKHYNVYVFPEFDSIVCILSFDNIKMIEGTEWDWVHFEEVQDCQQTHVETVISRLRRGKGGNEIVYAGMPDDETHWMYAYFQRNNVPLYEPPLMENAHNLPPDYLPRMKRMYVGADFDRYVEGKRVSLFRSKCLPRFQWDVHVKSDYARKHTVYDPALPIYFTWDFNVAPMCVSAWQKKLIDFPHGGYEYGECPKCEHRGHPGQQCSVCQMDTYRLVRKDVTYKRKEVLCQVDEWEVWGATTGDVCDLILETYGDHMMGGTTVGDATGQKRDTRSPGVTDWTIIRQKLGRLPGMRIVPGVKLIRKDPKTKRKRGERKLEGINPPVRDRVMALNRMLIDPDGDPGILFLPESQYMSGGAAMSCASAKFDMESNIDDSNDEKEDRNLPRTHFFDGVGYLAYYLSERRGTISNATEQIMQRVPPVQERVSYFRVF